LTVISFRPTKKILEKLQELKKEKNLPMGTLLNNILGRYASIHHHLKSRSVLMPRDCFVELINLVDMEKTNKFIDACVYHIKELEITLNKKFNFDDLIQEYTLWCENNFMEFKNYENPDILVCRHDLGMKWSLLSIKFFKKIFERFGLKYTNEETENNYWRIGYEKPISF